MSNSPDSAVSSGGPSEILARMVRLREEMDVNERDQDDHQRGLEEAQARSLEICQARGDAEREMVAWLMRAHPRDIPSIEDWNRAVEPFHVHREGGKLYLTVRHHDSNPPDDLEEFAVSLSAIVVDL